MKNFSLHFRRAAAVLSLTVAPTLASATMLDLTAATGASGTLTGSVGGTAVFQQMEQQSTGTGVLAPFLRIQENGTESGYNTDAAHPSLDAKQGSWTHDLLISAVPVVSIGANSYYQLVLDINQTGANPLLSLDTLKIYKTNTTGQTGDTPVGTLIWDMGANWIKLDYSMNSGSGSGDMFAYIPVADTTGFTNMILFSGFGSNLASNAGFEEWAVLPQSAPVPEPGTILLLGAGLLGIGLYGRKRSNA